MSKQFQLDIVTPDNNLLSQKVDMIVIRTTEGDVGVMFDHEPTVAPLAIGALKIKVNDTVRVAACSGGFVNIGEDHVMVITDAAEWVEDIDKARAESAKLRAQERLLHVDKDIDLQRAKVSLKRAMNRIYLTDNHIRHD